MNLLAFIYCFVGWRFNAAVAQSNSLSRLYKYTEDYPQCDLKISCKGDKEVDDAPIKLPIRGPRGPPGEKGEDGLPGAPGIPGMPAPAPIRIAFFVGLLNNIGPKERNEDIKFDNVVTNVGGGYQRETGRFRAPIRGLYHFTAVISPIGGHKAAAYLMKNDESLLTIWAESLPFWSSASNTIILELSQGDEVYLVLMQRASYLHGYMYTTFSGYVLFDDSMSSNFVKRLAQNGKG